MASRQAMVAIGSATWLGACLVTPTMETGRTVPKGHLEQTVFVAAAAHPTPRYAYHAPHDPAWDQPRDEALQHFPSGSASGTAGCIFRYGFGRRIAGEAMVYLPGIGVGAKAQVVGDQTSRWALAITTRGMVSAFADASGDAAGAIAEATGQVAAVGSIHLGELAFYAAPKVEARYFNVAQTKAVVIDQTTSQTRDVTASSSATTTAFGATVGVMLPALRKKLYAELTVQRFAEVRGDVPWVAVVAAGISL